MDFSFWISHSGYLIFPFFIDYHLWIYHLWISHFLFLILDFSFWISHSGFLIFPFFIDYHLWQRDTTRSRLTSGPSGACLLLISILLLSTIFNLKILVNYCFCLSFTISHYLCASVLLVALQF